MSDAHKEALKAGREQGRIVREYLEALDANKPKRGRKRTPESIQKRLSTIEEQLTSTDPLSGLLLRQERQNLHAELANTSEPVDMAGLEDAFARVAAEYGKRKGISYAVWREVGVDAAVLKRAGISRAG